MRTYVCEKWVGLECGPKGICPGQEGNTAIPGAVPSLRANFRCANSRRRVGRSKHLSKPVFPTVVLAVLLQFLLLLAQRNPFHQLAFDFKAVLVDD